jgi:hypothetical protein
MPDVSASAFIAQLFSAESMCSQRLNFTSRMFYIQMFDFEVGNCIVCSMTQGF